MELPIREDRIPIGLTVQELGISFSIMVLASVLMVFMASVNRALMSLLTSRWKPSITWQKILFLMIASTNSTRAAAAKSLFRAKCRCLKGSVLVAKKMNSGRACCSSGRVFSMLSQWRTRARADGPPSVAVC